MPFRDHPPSSASAYHQSSHRRSRPYPHHSSAHHRASCAEYDEPDSVHASAYHCSRDPRSDHRGPVSDAHRIFPAPGRDHVFAHRPDRSAGHNDVSRDHDAGSYDRRTSAVDHCRASPHHVRSASRDLCPSADHRRSAAASVHGYRRPFEWV